MSLSGYVDDSGPKFLSEVVVETQDFIDSAKDVKYKGTTGSEWHIYEQSKDPDCPNNQFNTN